MTIENIKEINLESHISRIKKELSKNDDFNDLSNFYKEMKEKKIAKEPSFDLPIINSFSINDL